MVMQPMTEKQMTRVVQITVREVFAELIPRIHATMTAAYDDGVRDGVSKSHKRNAEQGHEEHRNAKRKVYVEWLIMKYGGPVAGEDNKQFARRMIRDHRLKVQMKTVQNWLSEFAKK